jgi:hypothetical protein
MLGCTSVVLSSQTVTGSAVALSDTTVYPNGFYLSNADATFVFYVSKGAAAATPGAGNYPVAPGGGVYLAGAPSGHTVIAASGSPVAGIVGLP